MAAYADGKLPDVSRTVAPEDVLALVDVVQWPHLHNRVAKTIESRIAEVLSLPFDRVRGCVTNADTAIGLMPVGVEFDVQVRWDGKRRHFVVTDFNSNTVGPTEAAAITALALIRRADLIGDHGGNDGLIFNQPRYRDALCTAENMQLPQVRRIQDGFLVMECDGLVLFTKASHNPKDNHPVSAYVRTRSGGPVQSVHALGRAADFIQVGKGGKWFREGPWQSRADAMVVELKNAIRARTKKRELEKREREAIKSAEMAARFDHAEAVLLGISPTASVPVQPVAVPTKPEGSPKARMFWLSLWKRIA